MISENSRWQNLFDLDANDIFPSNKIKEYETKIDTLWYALSWARTSWRVIIKVHEFPIDMFGDLNLLHFLPFLTKGLVSYSLLILTNAITDKRKDALTFQTLSKWMIDNSNEEYRNDLIKYIKSLDINQIQNDFKTFKSYRDNALAHMNSNYSLKATDIKELDQRVDDLITTAKGLLDSLSIGSERLMEYLDVEDDALLNLFIKCSPVLNMPEEQPEFWDVYKRKFNDEKKQDFNTWRVKIGKKPVNF